MQDRVTGLNKWTGTSIKSQGGKVFFVALLGFICCFFISYPLWFPVSNLYPSVPVFESLSTLPKTLNYIISTLFIVLLFISISPKFRVRGIIPASLVVLTLALSLDYLRIQPWVFYYFFVILTFVVYPSNRESDILDVIRIILACIYFWSGVQKLNFTFLFDTYPWLIDPLTGFFSENLTSMLENTALFAPATEIICGIGLLFRKTQKTSMYLLVFMHAFILLMLGPIGHNSNLVIWPWNISFAIILVLLFQPETDFSITSFFSTKKKFYKSFIVILFGILPALSFFNLWPMYFSSALYSSNKVKSEIFMPEILKSQLSEQVQSKINDQTNGLILNVWTQNELNVASYPNDQVHKKTFESLCNAYPEYEMEMILVTKSKPDIFTGETKESTYFCDEL